MEKENKSCIYEFRNVKITVYEDKDSCFYAGRKKYGNISDLASGFSVVSREELYPCFDYSDHLYENRYYYWYFPVSGIIEAIKLDRYLKRSDKKFSQVYAPSESDPEKSVYEDVPLPMVFCEDGLKTLIVAEKK